MFWKGLEDLGRGLEVWGEGRMFGATPEGLGRGLEIWGEARMFGASPEVLEGTGQTLQV